MKNSYKKFAYYYDEVVSTLDYNLWYDFVLPYIKKDNKILDLACGTGTFASLLAINGYNASGLDLSEEIIEIANEKRKLNRLNIPFYVADMRTFKFDEKYDVITCFFDSINFLKTKNDLKQLFNSVYNSLNNNGYFIFDIFSKYMMDEYSNNEINEDYETFKINWKTTKLNNTELVHKLTISEDDDVIIEEYHEYFHNLNDLLDNRFKVIKISGDFNDDLTEEDERILIILQK